MQKLNNKPQVQDLFMQGSITFHCRLLNFEMSFSLEIKQKRFFSSFAGLHYKNKYFVFLFFTISSLILFFYLTNFILLDCLCLTLYADRIFDLSFTAFRLSRQTCAWKSPLDRRGSFNRTLFVLFGSNWHNHFSPFDQTAFLSNIASCMNVSTIETSPDVHSNRKFARRFASE